ncbi:MAG: hypothetical protein WEG36_08090 [Gemmatimonadota bacterium]
MHLLVTERLACPHCGPDFGLVLVADRLENRRVLEGFFGCANCQARYPVREGFGDLRPAPGGGGRGVAAEGGTPESASDPEAALALAALLGLTVGSGFILLTGRSVGNAEALSGMGDGFEILAAHPRLEDSAGFEGVSRMAIGARFPFRTRSLRGVVLEGRAGMEVLDEGGRVLAPGSRLVLLDPPSEGRGAMEGAGLQVLAGDKSALVGALK